MGAVSLKARAGQTIYLPTRGPGNSSLVAPFQTSSSSRLQQVYAQESFLGIPPTLAFLIHGVSFEIDESSFGFDEILPEVQVNLSTTSKSPDGLSTIFSENVGADETVVFGRGPLHLRGNLAVGPGFMFDRPFLYDLSAGNLLLDIRNFGPGNASPLDAFDARGDSISIVVGDADATSGFAFTRGLATVFWVDIVPIPEPSTIALMVLGMLALAWRLRRAKKTAYTQG